MVRRTVIPRIISRAACLVLLLNGILSAQTTPVDGIRKNTPAVHAFTNARIVKAPGQVLDNATLVIRNGIIESLGNVSVPKDARVWDLKGMTIYPGLIDAYSDYGLPKPPQRATGGGEAAAQRATPPEPQRGPIYWNNSVLAQLNAADLFVPDPKAAEQLRSQGFTAVLIVPTRGIIRGTSAVVNLGDGKPSELVLRPQFAEHISLQVDYTAGRYPTSLMGLIALVRQTLYDSDWYQKAQEAYRKNPKLPRPEINETLAALHPAVAGSMPVVIEVSDEQDFLRAEKIADEFKLDLILREAVWSTVVWMQ